MACSQRSRRTYSRFIFFLLFLFAGIKSFAQLLDTRVTINLGQGSLDRCVLQLQQATGYSFAYESSGLQSFTAASRTFRNEKLSHVLNYLFKGTGYIFEEKHHVIIIGPTLGTTKKMSPYQFNGVIEDKETGAKLEGVAVYDPNNRSRGTFTDHNGYFSLTAASDTLKLRLTYLSYKPVEIVLRAVDAPLIRIKMNVASEGLDSVLVGDPNDISPVSLSKLSSSPRSMSFLPKFCGDVDLISLLKATPGVQEAKDGSGTLIVRGGAPDQNLLLVDDINIYGATHLFGLLSSVNVNAVKEVDIYKGAFPARFSGRISSVWDLAMKEGNREKIHGNLSIGTMASDLMVEGPLGSPKTTFLIAGRRSYHDLYTRLFTPGLTFYFQDFNLKLRQELSKKDHLFLTAYASQDRFQLDTDDSKEDANPKEKHTIALNTENYAGGIRWRHDFSTRLLTNLSFSYSAYQLASDNRYSALFIFPHDVGITVKQDGRTNTGLYDLTGKFQVKYNPGSNHELEAGAYYIRHTFRPYKASVDITSTDTSFVPATRFEEIINDTASTEIGGYLEDKITITDLLKASIGFHINQYRYDKKSYFSFQPRINVSYQVGNSWFLNAAYVKMQQNLHRLTISQTSLPLDFWIPSSSMLKPQTSNQYSAGVSGNLWNGLIDLGVEAYYKDMNNVAEYLIVSSATSEPSNWSQDVTTGKGAAYGIEFSIRKSKGNFNGWLSYALAWSNRTLPEVNNGQKFPYKYDRRHNLNLVALYRLGKSLELSAVFSFQSKPKTPIPIIKTSDISDDAENLRQNAASANIRAYHRLDLGINWNKDYPSGLSGTWNLSVFNVYNRENTFYYFSSNSQMSGNSLLPISASLSYTLRF